MAQGAPDASGPVADVPRVMSYGSMSYGPTDTPRHDVSPETSLTPRQKLTLEEGDDYEYEDCEEGAYSGAMGTIIKDMQRLSHGSQHTASRVLRMLAASSLAVALVLIQLFVLYTIKTFVTSPAVRSIRQVYDEYEKIMYHGHVRDTGYGFSVGEGGPNGPFFDPRQFAKVSSDLKGSVCIIPFSQLPYLSIILFIWTLSVVGELRMVFLLLRWMWEIPRANVDQAIEKSKEGFHVIVGLPLWMKGLTCSLVLIPRLFTSLILLWLGCRWLAATLDTTEVLINSIALEFVIRLNVLLYSELMSDRSKRELKNLKLDMRHQKGTPPHALSLIGAFVWVIVSVGFIYMYLVHLQMVLPGYNWDVRGPCKPWVSERFNFWRI